VLPLLKCTAHCADTHCLVSINIPQSSINVSGCHSSTWRNSVTHLCFICTSIPDGILSDCPSAAICCTAKKSKGTLVGGFIFYCVPPTSTSGITDQRDKMGGATFGAPLVQMSVQSPAKNVTLLLCVYILI